MCLPCKIYPSTEDDLKEDVFKTEEYRILCRGSEKVVVNLFIFDIIVFIKKGC
jgi:hypothetical protein